VNSDRFAIRPSRANELLHGGETIDLGGVQLEVIHAPGHSPGGIVLLDRDRGILFSTDVAYASMLYCIADHSDLAVYVEAMARLAELSPSLRVCYPSHDAAAMDPALLPRMRDALAAVLAGREPDGTFEDDLLHRFDGFSVRIRPGAVP
jgi:glyoxylase-like metal-dependent hydrolase (beta-lactamase superfamily II)